MTSGPQRMTRRKGTGSTPARPWEPFRRTVTGINRVTGEQSPVPDNVELWGNNLYNVHLYRLEPANDKTPPMVWLSISRKDRKTIRDWRHLQRIKNELVGPECEGMELFPAESRLVDTSNQFHLFCSPDPTFRFPWGYQEREVMDREELAADPDAQGAVQRPFDE